MSVSLRRLARILAALLGVALLAIGALWFWVRPPDLGQPPELDPPVLAVPAQGRLVLADVTVVEPALSRSAGRTVIVEDARIFSIDAYDPASAGAEAAPRYAGSFVLPGLVDMHGHHPFPWLRAETLLWDLLYLAHGVTTVRDPGVADGSRVGTTLLDLRRRLREGEIPGPRLYACGAMVSGPWELPGSREARTAEQARTIVAELAAAGVDCVKVRSRLSPEVLAAVREAATQHGLRVIGHVPLAVPFEEAYLDDAQHFFGFSERRPVRRWADLWGAWGGIDPRRMDEIVRVSLEQGVAHTPTLVVWARHARLLDPGGRDDPMLRLLPVHWREAAWKPGASLHEELGQFVEAGIPLEKVWSIATHGAGGWLGEPGLGRLAIGAPADLLVFREDPTRDLAALSTLEAVVAQGRLYTREWLGDALERYREHFASDAYASWSLGIDRRLARSAKLTGVALRAVARLAPQ